MERGVEGFFILTFVYFASISGHLVKFSSSFSCSSSSSSSFSFSSSSASSSFSSSSASSSSSTPSVYLHAAYHENLLAFDFYSDDAA
ncbi:hypothetical protein M8J77_020224 [Diaphorina citri]|nr:hypothetical protein M8J77_020224 [Diaphorina citri]